MSIIVAVTKNDCTAMAADSLTCFGDDHCVPSENARTSKIRRLGDSIVGSAGWAVYDRILSDFLADREGPLDLSSESAIFTFLMDLWAALHKRYSFVNDQAQSRDSPFGDLDSSFLIANACGIFKVSHDMDVCSFRQYYAIGTGADYALGAMLNLHDGDADAETLACRAVETATQFDVHCGGEIDVLTVP
ncbi:MAG: Ntn hydrolase family protein [Planctomycetota bacterium]|jgi:ATP-dependent protease HslVU (ClpYQ) peptidase subunit